MKSQEDASLLIARRKRLHELVVAMIHQQDDLDLLDGDTPQLESNSISEKVQDPARWLDRNRRVLKSYQSLVRSAVTLDALLDAEQPLDR